MITRLLVILALAALLVVADQIGARGAVTLDDPWTFTPSNTDRDTAGRAATLQRCLTPGESAPCEPSTDSTPRRY